MLTCSDRTEADSLVSVGNIRAAGHLSASRRVTVCSAKAAYLPLSSSSSSSTGRGGHDVRQDDSYTEQWGVDVSAVAVQSCIAVEQTFNTD